MKVTKKVKKRNQFRAVKSKRLVPAIECLNLSQELLDWYQAAAPIDVYVPCHGDDLWLYNPLELVKRQEGYRWIFGDRESVIEDWDKRWVVIGGHSGDPVIAHVDQSETPISMAIHGIGVWAPQLVAPSLSAFLDALLKWLDVVSKYDELITGPDDALLPGVIADFRASLSSVLDEQCIDNLLSFIE